MNRVEVLIWARRICAARNAEPHIMLDIRTDASVEDAQVAYHGLARVAHPDLHRTGATPEELDLITNAFSLVASAYHAFRTQRMQTTKMAALKVPARTTTEIKKVTDAVPTMPLPTEGIAPERTSASIPQMNSRALTFYRKAELSLRRGDLPTATLHLKMAIAADPQSAFLRQALKEIQSELGKKP